MTRWSAAFRSNTHEVSAIGRARLNACVHDVLERQRAAINQGDLPALLETVSEDVVWGPMRAATEGDYAGHEGMKRWFHDTVETFEVFHLDVAEFKPGHVTTGPRQAGGQALFNQKASDSDDNRNGRASLLGGPRRVRRMSPEHVRRLPD